MDDLTSLASGQDAGQKAQTFIFLDVDGVLNIGIRDPESNPLSFNESNVSVVRKLLKGGNKTFSDQLIAVMRTRTCDGNESTYGDFLSRNDLDVCDIFVHRLVKILRASGESRRVILSSSWRRPKYADNLQRLETIISGYLGESFCFDDTTDIVDESGAGSDRLRLIGEYMSNKAVSSGAIEPGVSRIKILVLDDFYYRPITGFDIRGTPVNSLQEAESYLAKSAPPSIEANVRIIHTYLASALPTGVEVGIGTGLSLQHLGDALEFLGVRISKQLSRPEDTRSMEDWGSTPSIAAECVDTLIFLDIDGVLNVGIRDVGGPLSFNEANFSIARKLFKGNTQSDTAEMLLAVMRMQTCEGNSSTYGDFLSRNDLDVCDTFVHRLVKIIRAGGARRKVVLASSWRRAKYKANVEKLEQIISGYLGETWHFDAQTAKVNEVSGPDRLKLIGDFIQTYCNESKPERVKALVLDDFFYLPIQNFNCEGNRVDSVKEAESYLQSRAPASTEAKVRIIHTYLSSKLPSGLQVQVGTGLSSEHVADALAFLTTSQFGSPDLDVKPVPVPSQQQSAASGKQPVEPACCAVL